MFEQMQKIQKRFVTDGMWNVCKLSPKILITILFEFLCTLSSKKQLHYSQEINVNE